ncbi:MAG TPA: DUF3137 domain-containing protein [bacterium]|nr:DUF3137 domain-containing protein [bacterium]
MPTDLYTRLRQTNEELRPLMEELEGVRVATVRRIVIAAVILGSLGLAASGFLALTGFDNPGLGFALGIIAWMLYGSWTMQGYVRRFKREVISRAVTVCGPELKYEPHRGIARAEFNAAGLFSGYDDYKSEDEVCGYVGATQVRFSEVTLWEHRGSGKNRRRVKVFDGLFFQVDFPKAFNGRTYIHRQADATGLALTGWLRGLPPRVALEDPEFERAFQVYGTDPVEARYLLSTSFMERLMEYRNRKGDIRASFVGDHFHLALPMWGEFLEPPLFSSILKGHLLEDFVKEVLGAISLVEELNLNTRLWGEKAVEAYDREQQRAVR